MHIGLSCCTTCYSCILLFIFLFFKQKTAYEMRISDWSSDVCSSDLFSSSELFYPPVAVTSFLQKNPTNERIWAVGNAAIHPNLHTQQIGRASRRERVCQYV